MTNCGPGSRQESRKINRTAPTFQPNRWASPAHTPAIIRSFCGRVRVDWVALTKRLLPVTADLAVDLHSRRYRWPVPRGTPGEGPGVPHPGMGRPGQVHRG